MTLSGDFYFLSEEKKSDHLITAAVQFNAGHKIFYGHFPQMPIVPGVCMIQLIQEIFEKNMNRKYLLRHADNIKFLAVINPLGSPQVEARIQYKEAGSGSVDIDAAIFSGSVTYFKLKATLHPE
jgi:3-hydroxyacyl-[acyl-carrier-protein] dehydratase